MSGNNLQSRKKWMGIGALALVVVVVGAVVYFNKNAQGPGGSADQNVLGYNKPNEQAAVGTTGAKLLEANGEVTIEKDGKVVARAKRSDLSAGTLELLSLSTKFAYVGVKPEAIDGYVLFSPGVYTAYRLKVGETAQVKPQNISRGESALQAISPDDMWVAYADYGSTKNVVLKNLQTGKEVLHAIPGHYSQFGSMMFAPDSKKLAYAVARGFPGLETGGVFTVEVPSGKETLVALTKERDTYFVVKGWDKTKVQYATGPNLNK